MKHALLYALGLITLGLFGLAASPARADAVGPYYATPSWDQTLPASTRFIVLSNFSDQAVLDRETGLVWQQMPPATGFVGPGLVIWAQAALNCMETRLGNREGWRLPTIHELQTLADTNGSLPAGHPFSNVDTTGLSYWSTTDYPGDSAYAMTRGFQLGTFGAGSTLKTAAGAYAWCVRGSPGVDANAF